MEVELSADERQLAWSSKNSKDIYILNLNDEGSCQGACSSTLFAPPASAVIQNAGIEFSPDGKTLYVSRRAGALKGIWAYHIPTGQLRILDYALGYGNSQLELAYDTTSPTQMVPYLYAANASSILKLDLSSGQPALTLPLPAGTTLPFDRSTMQDYLSPRDGQVYGLVDQVDGDYEHLDNGTAAVPDLTALTGNICSPYPDVTMPIGMANADLSVELSCPTPGNCPTIARKSVRGGEVVRLSTLPGVQCGAQYYVVKMYAARTCGYYGSPPLTSESAWFTSPPFRIECVPAIPQISINTRALCSQATAVVALTSPYPASPAVSVQWSSLNGSASGVLSSQVSLPPGDYSVTAYYAAPQIACGAQTAFTIAPCPQMGTPVTPVTPRR